MSIEEVPNKNQLDELARRAKETWFSWHGYIESLPLESRKPVVVEFAGSPKSGKTTCIDIVQHFFKRVGYKPWAPSEGASQLTPYALRRDLLAFNTWTLNYAISELLLACYNRDMPDLVLLDRGPFDSLAWMNMLHKQPDSKLDEESLQIMERFAAHPQWSTLVDRVVIIICDPKVSLDREYKSKLIQLPGTAMNERFLRALLKEYKALQNRLVELAGDKPLFIETTDMTKSVTAAYVVAVEILNLYEQRITDAAGRE